MFCNVIITRPFDQVFTYKLKEGQAAKEGSVVLVPFGKSKNQIGMVSQINKNILNSSNFKIKEVETVFQEITLNKNIIKFIQWISDYTLSPIGLVLKLFLILTRIFQHFSNLSRIHS